MTFFAVGSCLNTDGEHPPGGGVHHGNDLPAKGEYGGSSKGVQKEPHPRTSTRV